MTRMSNKRLALCPHCSGDLRNGFLCQLETSLCAGGAKFGLKFKKEHVNVDCTG